VAANQVIDPDWIVAWIAGEPYNFEQAKALGVDNSRVIVVDTNETETAYEAALNFVESKTVDCCVIDSYPALIPIEEADKTMGETVVAVGARLTGKFFRKMGKAMHRDAGDRPITCFFVNQLRDKIGGFSPRGTPTTTPGGNAKNYFFYVRAEVTRADFIDEARPGKGKVRVGQEVKLRTVKNKSAAPQQVATTRFFFRDAPYLGFNRGDYDLAAEYLAYALTYDIITRGGAMYSYGDRKWKGQDATMAALRDDVDLQQDLREEILRISQIPDRERIKVGE
jgi:recombination protein RecA